MTGGITATLMSEPLRATKLHAPPPRSEWVQRPRLLERLDDRKSGLILLSTPAGSGKTTLLGEWMNQDSVIACWISLDSADYPFRLLTNIVAFTYGETAAFLDHASTNDSLPTKSARCLRRLEGESWKRLCSRRSSTSRVSG